MKYTSQAIIQSAINLGISARREDVDVQWITYGGNGLYIGMGGGRPVVANCRHSRVPPLSEPWLSDDQAAKRILELWTDRPQKPLRQVRYDSRWVSHLMRWAHSSARDMIDSSAAFIATCKARGIG